MSKPIVGEVFTFNMELSLEDLIYAEGMEGMNELMDAEFEGQYGGTEDDSSLTLTDISYKAIGVNPETEDIIIAVTGTVEDMSL